MVWHSERPRESARSPCSPDREEIEQLVLEQIARMEAAAAEAAARAKEPEHPEEHNASSRSPSPGLRTQVSRLAEAPDHLEVQLVLIPSVMLANSSVSNTVPPTRRTSSAEVATPSRGRLRTIPQA